MNTNNGFLIATVISFDNWKEEFITYLEGIGHTPKVAKDYANRINKITKDENITIAELSADIDNWIDTYKKGSRTNVNKSKHYAPSSALAKFKDFLPTLRKPYLSKKEDPLESLTKGPINVFY